MRFKIAFELYESASRERQDRGGLAMPAYSRDFVNYFNGFVMDLCNCLWRNRALNNADKNALGCQLPEYPFQSPLFSVPFPFCWYHLAGGY